MERRELLTAIAGIAALGTTHTGRGAADGADGADVRVSAARETRDQPETGTVRVDVVLTRE